MKMSKQLRRYIKGLEASRKIHKFLEVASKNGGIWVSVSRGTANVLAGELSKKLNCGFLEAHRYLDITGGNSWYEKLARLQPWPYLDMDAAMNARFDAKTIAKAALRNLK
jgi:hypothetical protein